MKRTQIKHPAISSKPVLLLLFMLCTGFRLSAQDVDLFKLQDEQNKKEKKEKTDITTSTFKTTRLINGQSIENTGAGILDLKISHRFGMINTGAYNFFGLDQASMRLGLDYGITNRLEVGIGRSTYNKEFDGFVKYRLLRQSTGKVNMPVSVSLAASAVLRSLKDPPATYPINSSDHFSFTDQVLIARKFGDYFSLQLAPTMVHYNLVASKAIPNDLYSVGTGFRLRLSKRVNLTGEYYYQVTQFEGTTNALSLGFDIETGGHVFQLHFTNSTGINESSFITQTTGKWGDGGIHFGFNISRVFTVVKPKKIN
ncbi:DUF5777 family beta-barrel protein [Mucilaginibacter xinganensis]|uniref:DUF5777 domain-containing protein n=1 Tax=Mucilaginibacter xinganensis TaxID=1234841 RepID=A0A223P3T9_9SPHI|nr:DUF5777 family beta-barrel protein [Mucilaginibacter xinganensis]ASU36752.1 hypothetical protein MuYL_4869 [Mucilaginibacter xinganensis]